MKRSHSIALVLLSGASAGTFAGCADAQGKPIRISTLCVYANNYYVPGAGYYHAPFHAFFAKPYNLADPKAGLYYAGGVWRPAPFQSEINLSSPTAEAAQKAEAARTDVVRNGFGRSGWGGYGG